jgi:uroporphyrinogen decarboxylase
MMSNYTNNGLTGKELIFATLRHEKTSSVPWVPYAGVHAGKLKGYSAQEILTDADKLVESLLAVNEVYDPDGQPVLFDLQLEAEILGCDLFWAENSPPSVASHPLANTLDIPSKLPEKTDGRLPIALRAMQEMKSSVGEQTALYGLITGPLTLASHLRGTEIFMDLIRQPEHALEVIAYCNKVAIRMADLYIDAGMDIIAFVDPLLSQISPKHFAQFLTAAYTSLFAYVRERDVFSSLFVCGDATKNIELMCQTNPDSIAVDENINMLTAKEITDRYNVTLSGNIPLTTVMLLGTQQDNMKFVVDFLDSIDTHNFILAPGCDMPYDTPIENVVGALQAVRDPHETRHMLATYQAPEIDLDSVQLPDYQHIEKPLIEVFTLDSASCAACGYMLEAAKGAAAEFGEKVELVEYKFTVPENVARVIKMEIQHLPTITINGHLTYSSIIPSKDEFVAEIQKYL